MHQLNDPVVLTYLAYLAISLSLTIWVSRTLHRNGRLFLVDVFQGRTDLADSVNHLLVVGFYLVNFGYVSLALRIGGTVASARASIEILSWKVGLVLVMLGAMHFFNLYVLNRYRRRAERAGHIRPTRDEGQGGGRPADQGPASGLEPA